eukprot:11046922-Ditylum_brightwellii.AAC.1
MVSVHCTNRQCHKITTTYTWTCIQSNPCLEECDVEGKASTMNMKNLQQTKGKPREITVYIHKTFPIRLGKSKTIGKSWGHCLHNNFLSFHQFHISLRHPTSHLTSKDTKRLDNQSKITKDHVKNIYIE